MLPVLHDNYNSIFSLALASAINRYSVRIRTTRDINPDEPGEVMYFWVRWP